MNFMGGSGKLRGPGGRRGDIVPEGYSKGQLAQFTPEQNELFKQSFAHLGPDSYLSRLAGGEEGMFNEIEAPALRQFQGTLGGIASRFSGQGMGGRRSSGFQQATTSAASNFAQELQANRQNLQRQAISDLMGLSNQLLNQRPYERFMAEKPQEGPSGFQQFVGGALPIAGAAVGGFFGGMPGAQLGATTGAASSQGFFGG
jgi:hypothetical protein